MPKQWFILHVLSGHELKVQKNIQSRVQQAEMDAIVGEVLIPSEKVSEVKQGRKTTINRKFFPGYVLIHIALYDEQNRLNERAWDFVQNTPSVIGFLGGVRPTPMSEEEVQSILHQIESKKEKVVPKVMFEPGEMVKVTEGPFVSMSGMIHEVDPSRGILKIAIVIFGAERFVELEYWKVERVVE